jgi:copper(I)-binding protein
LTVTNNGTTPDRLNCVSDDASAKCQIHSITTENGFMKMRPVEAGLEIKPGETVMLKRLGLCDVPRTQTSLGTGQGG